MSFYKRYELQRLIADGEAKTFRAVENATGRNVFLHLFNPGGQALLAALKAKLAGPGGKPVPPLLEIGEFAGSQYAVTEVSEPFSGLRDWVNQQPDAPPAANPAPPVRAQEPRPPAPPAPSRSPAPLDDEPGEFTRQFPPSEPVQKPVVAAKPPGILTGDADFAKLFALSEPVEKPSEPVRPPAARKLPGLLDDSSGQFNFNRGQPPSHATSADEDQGDFTRAFGPGPSKAPDIVRPRVPAPPRSPAPPPPVPRRREVEAPPSAPPDWTASADTGEFTKLFGSGLSGEAIDIAGEQAKAARATPIESRPFQKAGEFTRIFGPEMGGEVPGAAQPSAPPSLNTNASELFGSPEDLAKLAKEALNAPKASGSRSDTGEYTSVFGEKKGPPEPQKPPEAGKPAAVVPIAPEKPKMRPAVIAGLVAAGVLLIALIVLAVVLSSR